MTKKQIPAVEGLFTTIKNDGVEEPYLIGGRGKSRESYFFPKDLAGRDPASVTDSEIEEVLLSRQGKVWSFTTGGYAPPPPYIAKEPWEPFVLAGVLLEKEKLVVLGQMVEGTQLEDMKIGMNVELVIDTLYEDEENEYLVWKWKTI